MNNRHFSRSSLLACGLLLVLMAVPCVQTWRATAASGEKNSLQWLPVREWGFDAGVVSEASCGIGPSRIVPSYSFWKFGAYEVRRPRPVTSLANYTADKPVASKSQLEQWGVTVITESDGVSYGLVASLPDEKFGLASQYLHKAHIEGFGSCGLDICGLYVPVRDFVQAGNILQQMRPQLQMGHHRYIWIWHR